MKNGDVKISIITNTYNSGETIVNTLESVSVFGEIIAIDEHSSDDTIEILKEYKVKTIYADKTNRTEAFKQALNEAKGDWILLLEDDEIAPKDLLSSLIQYTQNPKKNKNAVAINIKVSYLNKEIKSACKKNIVRFFKKDYCSFKENNSFEPVVLLGKTHKLKTNCILKYPQGDISRLLYDVIDKNKNILKYSSKKHCSLLIVPFFTFLYFYIFKFGFLDGIRGYIFAKEKTIEKFILETMLFEKKFKEKK